MRAVLIITLITVTIVHCVSHHSNQRAPESFDLSSNLLREKNSTNEQEPYIYKFIHLKHISITASTITVARIKILIVKY